MGFFSSSRLSPETVPTDRVIPLTFWDDQDYARAITLDITFTFNDRLDPGKLHNALDDLLRRKGWQKFGARLRRNVRFGEQVPPLRYGLDHGSLTE